MRRKRMTDSELFDIVAMIAILAFTTTIAALYVLQAIKVI